ncbi:MAG: Maf family protein [Bacteroidia bacterium]
MRVILASASPRRESLLRALGWSFEIRHAPIEETYPPTLRPAEIAMYVALQKALYFLSESEKAIFISADTLVALGDTILSKPQDLHQARHFLHLLSGKTHQVYTGVCILHQGKAYAFYERTHVTFHKLSEEIIETYLRRSPPLDKAGAYGAQDLIGLVGIKRLRGDFYNVMGLPVQKLYRVWKKLRLPLPYDNL